MQEIFYKVAIRFFLKQKLIFEKSKSFYQLLLSGRGFDTLAVCD